MTEEELIKFAAGLKQGYAYDMLAGLLNPDSDAAPLTSMECGDLFRTLILDEGVSVDTASRVYYRALALAELAEDAA